MTKAGIIYHTQFTNFEGSNVVIQIYDNSVQIDNADDEETFDFELAEDALHIVTTDNDESKHTPIKSKKAVIKFLNSNAVNFRTFASGEDDRFFVDILLGGKSIFKGFLQQADITEPFLPTHNQEVVLTAIDGLAYLRDIPLTDFDSDNPTGKNRLIDYIAWCLSKTGVGELNINVVNNLREQDSAWQWQTTAQFTAPHTISVPLSVGRFFKSPNQITITGSGSNDGTYTIATVTNIIVGYLITVVETVVNEASGPTITFEDITDGGHFYARQFLDAKTFEDEIGKCKNCYECLQMILGHDCFLTQHAGEWWIMRVKEYRNDFPHYVAVFDFEGGYTETRTRNYEKAIGLGTFTANPDATSYFSQEETSQTKDRPNKSVKLKFNFDTPQEIPCNINFERGTQLSISATEEILTVECWTYKKAPFSPITGSATSDQAHIRRVITDGYETARYAVLPANATDSESLFSEAIELSAKDKISISVDWAWSVNNGGAGTLTKPIFYVWLVADDGTHYTLDPDDGSWALSNSGFTSNIKAYIAQWVPDDVDETEFRTASMDSMPLPKTGKVYISLQNSGNDPSTSDDADVYFNNLQVSLNQFINGSYQDYSGQHNKFTRAATATGDYKSKIEEEVFIEDAPKKILKGALFTYDGSNYNLVNSFYEGQEFLLGNDGTNNLYKYGYLRAIAYMNQYRNGNDILQVKCQGIDSSALDDDNFPDHVDIIHRYFNRDLEPITNKKCFQLVTIDIDFKLCEWTGTLVKNFDNDTGFITDTFEFKYIT